MYERIEKKYVSVLKIFRCLWEYLAFLHDDVIKWKHFQRYWPFVRGIHRSPVNDTALKIKVYEY